MVELNVAELDMKALEAAIDLAHRVNEVSPLSDTLVVFLRAYLAALPAALPKAEPVGWVDFDTLNFLRYGAYRKARITSYQDDVQTIPLYAAPPAGDDQ